MNQSNRPGNLPGKRLSIAVVGTGISGLSAAWLLSQRHQVEVYEQNDYVGGHSNTENISLDGKEIPVDTGFIVYNPQNYPNLVAMFEHLGVPTKPSEMSFSASLSDGRLEYSGTDLNGLFSQRRNLVRPRFWQMLSDIVRFYREAPGLIDDASLDGVSLREFLQRNKYSEAFIFDHLLPMGAAIWSASVDDMLEFPATAFIRFCDNHGLLKLTDRPEWRTVEGGSREYVRLLSESFADRIRCGDPVLRIVRDGHRPLVQTRSGRSEVYDHVVIACHSDQALRLLAQPSADERATLGQIRYQPNRAVLHTDTSLLPSRRRAWASWNYIGTRTSQTTESLCVTYWMNLLQGLPTRRPVLVTLNPNRQIDPDKVLRSYDYDHPVFDRAAMQAQSNLWNLQGHRNTWFCGAYFGSGFHEDGIQAGLAVGEMLGGQRRPWTLEAPSARIGLPGAFEPCREAA